MNIIFRKSIYDDVHQIIEIIKEAQDSFKLKGIDQWQNNYPSRSVIENDIHSGIGYVLTLNNLIIGTAVLSFNIEDCYNIIYNGSWLSNESYAVVHRMAIPNQYKGLGYASLIFKEIEKLCVKNNIFSIKVDTHRDNTIMVNLLQKNGFTYCGVVHLDDHSERLAYEKLVNL